MRCHGRRSTDAWIRAGDTSRPEGATLLDVLIDGFEKNEMLGGFHSRELPLPDDTAAVRKFALLVDEARRWKGPRSATRRSAAVRGN